MTIALQEPWKGQQSRQWVQSWKGKSKLRQAGSHEAHLIGVSYAAGGSAADVSGKAGTGCGGQATIIIQALFSSRNKALEVGGRQDGGIGECDSGSSGMRRLGTQQLRWGCNSKVVDRLAG